MSKLITKYLLNPSLENARRVAAYERSHPMASCLLATETERKALADALAQAGRG